MRRDPRLWHKVRHKFSPRSSFRVSENRTRNQYHPVLSAASFQLVPVSRRFPSRTRPARRSPHAGAARASPEELYIFVLALVSTVLLRVPRKRCGGFFSLGFCVIEPRRLGHQVILFWDARGPASSNAVVLDGAFKITSHLEQVSTNRV